MSFSTPTSHLMAAPPIPLSDRLRRVEIEVGDDDDLRPFAMKSLGERPADPVRSPRHHHHFSADVHDGKA